jgi:hypothetical protein
MMNISKKLLLFIGIALLATQTSWSQMIVATYNCAGAGAATLQVSPNTGIVTTSYTWKNTATNATVSTAATAPGLLPGSYSVTYSTVLGVQPALTKVIAANIVPTTPTVTPATLATPICDVSTQALISSTASNYAWQRDGSAIAGTSNTITVTGTDVSTAGTYNYTVSTTNSVTNCTATSVAVALKVSPKPVTPTVTAQTPVLTLICGSTTQGLTASGGGSSYSWKRGSTVLPTTTSNLTVTGTDATGTFLYTAALVNSVGCVSDFSTSGITLTLAPAIATPTISLVAPVVNPICGTATQGLTTTNVAGSNYFWKRDGVAISGSTNSITVAGTDVSTPGTYNYTVSVQNAAGCLSSDATPATLKVSPKPSTPSISPASFTPNIVCGTDFKTLAATNGGSKYNWKQNGTLVTSSTTTNTLIVSGADAATATGGAYTYTVNLENSVGCISDDSPTGVVLQLFKTVPAKPTISSNGINIFCEGNTVKLNSSYTVSTGFNVWSKTIGTTAQADTTTTGTDGVTVRSVGINTYTVKAKDVNGCTSIASNSFVVTVNALPAKPILNKTGAIEICDLDSTILSAVNNYTGGSYSWKNGSSSISTSKNLTLKVAGTYTLVYTEGVNQCASLASSPTVLSINLLPAKPTITNLRPTEFCFRDFTTLVASASNNPATVAGYEWDNGSNTNQITVTTTTKKTVDDILKFSVKSISSKGCKSKDASDFTTVTVYPLPTTPTISNLEPLTVCPDTVVRLVSSASPTSYIWTIVKDKIIFGDIQTVFINVTGKYYVQTVSLKNCASDPSNEVSVTIREAPQAASILAFPSSATVCKGGKVTLTALTSNGNIKDYSWKDEDTGKEVSTKPDLTVETSGKFSVKLRDTFGCFALNSIPRTVLVSPLPDKPTISIVKPKVFCDEDSTIVQSSLASTTPNGNKNLYRWIVDGTDIIESANRQFAWKKASSIAVAVTDSNGCKATIVSDTIRTTVNPLPNSPTITVRGAIPFCADKNVTLSAVATTGVTYKWSTGASTQNITINTPGNISVQTINGYGCLSKPSQAIQVRVNLLPTKPKLTALGDTIFCDGQRVRLVSSSPLKSYWWRSTTDSIGTGDDLTSYFATKTGKYFVKVEDANGCISLASTPISVDSRPNPTPTIIKKIGTFSLDAQGLGDENGYIWRYNGDVQKDLTTRIIKAKKDGDYQVQASISYNGLAIAGGKLVCYSKTSGILKYEQDVTFEGFSVFPNPTTNGEINVEVIEDLIGADIFIYDAYGQLIADYKIDKFNVIKKIQLPDYHGNTYIIKIISGGYEKTRKLITLKD